jgi:hypothetical protein
LPVSVAADEGFFKSTLSTLAATIANHGASGIVFQKKPISIVGSLGQYSGAGVRMNIDDSLLIAKFQLLITETLVEKRLGQRRPELTDELYQTWREVEQRGLKETPEYRNVLLRADRHAFWLGGLVRLVAPASSPETERTDTLDAPQKAA